MFNKYENDLLYSLALGDGCISKVKNQDSYVIYIGHGAKQKDYCEWKMKLFNDLKIFSNTISLHQTVIKDKKRDKEYKQYYFRKTSSLFKDLWDDFHSDNRVQQILSHIHSDRALAIWFMDDGSIVKKKNIHKDGSIYYRKPTSVLCTHCFSEEENKQISEWFQKRYMVNAKLSHETKKGVTYTFLRFDTKDTKKIYSIIRPFVKQIESMRYKFSYIEDYYY